MPDDISSEEQPFAERSRESLVLKGDLQLIREGKKGIATEPESREAGSGDLQSRLR